MLPSDYDDMMKMWTSSPDIGVNPDDSREYIEKFLVRNPNTSFVAVENGKIIGTVKTVPYVIIKVKYIS